VESIAVWEYLRKRAKIAGIQAAKIESFGRDRNGVGGDKEGLLSLMLMTELRTEAWSQRLAENELTEEVRVMSRFWSHLFIDSRFSHLLDSSSVRNGVIQELSELMKLNESGEVDDVLAPLQLHTLKPHMAKELLMERGVWSRVSVQEHHYYHFDEVWHAVYNRAEKRHMLDPENLDFKDDETKNRQLNLFKSIMVRHLTNYAAFVSAMLLLWLLFSQRDDSFLVAGIDR